MSLIFIRLKNFSIVLFFYIFFFVIGDLAFSNFIYKENINIKYDCLEYQDHSFDKITYYDYYLQKNCSAIEKQRTVIPYKVFTDKNGYRYSGNKRLIKENNLVFLGDSFTYGYGVKFENSFPGIVEKNVENYGIYNLGVPGYGIQKYHHMLSEFFKTKKASKIFITLDMTDVHDAAYRWMLIENSRSPVLKSKRTNKNISNWKKIQNSNFKGSKILAVHVKNFLRFLKIKLISTNMGSKDRALKSETANFTYIDKNKLVDLSNEDFQKSISNINLYMNKISHLTKQNNAELYLVIFPWPETLIYGQDEFNWEKFNYDLCKKNNCTKVINLFSDFEKIKTDNKNWKNLIYIDDDVHFKTFGKNLIANNIINEIVN